VEPGVIEGLTILSGTSFKVVAGFAFIGDTEIGSNAIATNDRIMSVGIFFKVLLSFQNIGGYADF
jgi:hypothetical protein